MQEVKTLETLVSALGQQVGTLAEKMNLQSDAIIKVKKTAIRNMSTEETTFAGTALLSGG